MDINVWHDKFIKVLSEKYPKRSQLVQALKDLLRIEREAVYRRLRNEVVFSTREIIEISIAWNISIDRMIGVNSGPIPFYMRPVDYTDPSEQDLNFLKYVIQSINSLKDFTDTEFMDVCNKLPRQFLAGFGNLNKFYLFKWIYQQSIGKNDVTFSNVVISEAQLRLTSDYYQAIKNVPQSNFIFDYMLFDYLTNDIRYFHAIGLVSDEEKDAIKNELYKLLDYLSIVAKNGCYPETQNKVNLYISRLNIDTNYSYTYTNKTKICFVHVFDKYEIHTFDPETVDSFISWMRLRKRAAFQITEVDKISSTEYFSKQRQLIESL